MSDPVGGMPRFPSSNVPDRSAAAAGGSGTGPPDNGPGNSSGPSYAAHRRPAQIIGLAILVAAVLGGGIAAYVLLSDDGSGDAPDGVAGDFLDAWAEGDFGTMQGLVGEPPADLTDQYEAFAQRMEIEEAEFTLDEVEHVDDDAEATFTADLTLAGLGAWSYEGTFRLARTGEDDAWQVAWSPAIIHPAQSADEHLRLTSGWPERGAITDAEGDPLVMAQDGTEIGIVPQRMDDPDDRDELYRVFDDTLDIGADRIDDVMDGPGAQPDHFLPVTTVPQPRYEEIEDELRPVPGVVFRETSVRAGPTQGFARHILGTTGEITAELLDELGPPYQVGDTVGLSGLERQFETALAGTPGGEIELVTTAPAESDEEGESGDDGGDGEEQVVEVVDTIEGEEPVDIRTTLDAEAQLAVEGALDGVEGPAAAVIVDREGNVQAAAARPLDELNRAFEGAYPPGSTFKIVTGEALLTSGVTPDQEVDCPATIQAGGREVSNFEDTELGTVPFRDAFANSCNTAFIGLSADLDSSDLVAAADRFGFNSEYSLGVPTAASTFPEPESPAEQAAASIGQGRTVASPLHMATVAAAVNEGTWHPPVLLPDLPDDEAPRPEPQPLDAGHAETLRSLMVRVVEEGSGEAAAVDGVTIAGKTGTAEFGEGDPLPTHAWFVGSRGDLSVAVLLEDGGVGGEDAAPVAGEILGQLPD